MSRRNRFGEIEVGLLTWDEIRLHEKQLGGLSTVILGRQLEEPAAREISERWAGSLISKSQGLDAKVERTSLRGRASRGSSTYWVSSGAGEIVFDGKQAGFLGGGELGIKVVGRCPKEISGIERNGRFTIAARLLAGKRIFLGLTLAWTATRGGWYFSVTLTGIFELECLRAEAEPERDLLHRDDRDEEKA